MKTEIYEIEIGKLKGEIKVLKELYELPKSKGAINLFIKKRDNYMCRLCFSTQDIQVHHITPKNLEGKDTYDNLITLCNKCHHFIHYCNPMIQFGVVGTSINELTKNGINKARAEGKVLGRRKGWRKVKVD